MKKNLKITVLALLAVGTLLTQTACSCNGETASSTETVSVPSTPSAVSTVSEVVSVPLDANFRSHRFEMRLYKTSNWSSFKAVSPKTTVVFSLSFPSDWTRAEGDAEAYLDAEGRKVMSIEYPVQMAEGKTLPELPAKSGSMPLSNEKISIAGIDGRLLVWDESTDEAPVFRYAYFMHDGDVTYRVNFYADSQSGDDRTLFDAVIDKLTNGK